MRSDGLSSVMSSHYSHTLASDRHAARSVTRHVPPHGNTQPMCHCNITPDSGDDWDHDLAFVEEAMAYEREAEIERMAKLHDLERLARQTYNDHTDVPVPAGQLGRISFELHRNVVAHVERGEWDGIAVYYGESCGLVQHVYGAGHPMTTPRPTVRTARGKRAQLIGLVDVESGYILPPRESEATR